jgi:hypothetical protein
MKLGYALSSEEHSPGFLRFCTSEILPRYERVAAGAGRR